MRTAVMYVLIGVILLAHSAPVHGALLFQQTWGGTNFDHAEGVAVAPDGKICTVGTTPSFSVSGDSDVFLLKYAPNGTLLLQRTYGTAGGFEDGNGVAVGPDGSIYVAGSSDNSKALLVKFAPNGALLWQRTWGGTQSEIAFGVAVSGRWRQRIYHRTDAELRRRFPRRVPGEVRRERKPGVAKDLGRSN
jgi:Domain of unknown function (DUF5122) beta-propeller